MNTESIAGRIARTCVAQPAGKASRLRSAVWKGLICAIAAAIAPLPTNASSDAARVDEAVRGWAQSWDKGDVTTYLGHYAESFVPAGGLTKAQWEQQRRTRLRTSALRHVMLRNLQIAIESDIAQAQFTQHYLDMDLMSTARKRLTLVKQDGAWKIREEHVDAERMARR